MTNSTDENEMTIGDDSTPRRARSDAETLRRLIEALEQAIPESRRKLLVTLATYFEIHDPLLGSGGSPLGRRGISVPPVNAPAGDRASQLSSFSADRAPSPKEFMMEKNAKTAVERVACLAYYLTHYRDSDGFKTLDLSKLNAEAAQLKLSNAAQAVDNATKAGFLIPHVRGQKRMSALGELYVQALPDHAAARSAMTIAKPRRKKKIRNNGDN